MKKFNLIIAMVVGSFLSMSVNAQTFNLTTGTGAVGTNDPIWTLRQPGSTTFNPVPISTGALQSGSTTYPNAYVQNNCGKWISPWLNAANNIISTPGTTGTFTYRMQFTIGECLMNPTAVLNFTFMAADNALTAVRVNTVPQTIPGGITHTASGSMTSSPTVVNGVNTIEVDVRNDAIYTALQLCGDIKVSGTPLGIPKNLNCCNAQKRNLLSWDAVSGATGYQVEILYNDSKCCRQGQTYGVIYPVTENVLLFSPTSCYSWRVRAVKGSCYSDWSEKKCGCYNVFVTVDPEPAAPSEMSSKNNNIANEVITKVMPNPANGFITVNIMNPAGTLKTNVCEFVLVNLSGQEVLRETVQLSEPKQVNVDGLKSGMYIYKVVTNGRVVATEKLVIN